MLYTTSYQFVFLDFEASSLSQDSWPIEIGLSTVLEDGTIETQDKLIKPWVTWPESAWSAQSAQIHHITRAMLRNSGEAADQVAHWAHDQLQGKTIVSDAPIYEHRWLSRLLDVVKAPVPRIVDIETAFGGTLKDKGLDTAFEYLSRTNVPHRAGPDSAIMATAWKYGREADADLRPVRP